MADVILSYSRQDNRIASEIYKRLTEADIDVWYDNIELSVGDSLLEAIEEAFNKASSVLLLLSQSSIKSPNITREYLYALEHNKPLYVALIDPIASEDIPFLLRDLRYVDLTSKQLEENLAVLIRAIKSQQTQEGMKRLYQSRVADEAPQESVTLEANLKQDNIDEVLEQVKKSLESGARSVKVVNVDDE